MEMAQGLSGNGKYRDGALLSSLQAAISNTQWIGIASMVITLGTPNQGDALADWIMGYRCGPKAA